MGKSDNKTIRVRAFFGQSASLVALIGASISGSVFAQGVAPQEEKATPADIVVTGTRVVRDGYRAPTPTTVIGEAEIAAKAPANLADYVNQLPSVAATSTPKANVAFISAGYVGINALNLRSLGENRTLVLLDGQRVAPSTLDGLIDVNQFPQALVKRVDVVTGGVSASWGSDAVSGVVNFVLDKDFTGLKGEVQGGVTTYGDDRQFKVSLSGGTKFADDRGHIMLSGEIAHNDGITGIGSRKWYDGSKIFNNPAYTATNGQPRLISSPAVGYLATAGGVITTPGALYGTYFGPGGTPARLNLGLVSGVNMQGGDWQYADFTKNGDLIPRLSRQNIFGRVSFDVTDNVQLFAQGSYGRATSRNAILNYLGFGITVQPDNAFIPGSIAGQITTPFTMNSFAGDLGVVTAHTKRTSWRSVIGAKGDLSVAGTDWDWDAYWQQGINHSYVGADVPINQNAANAFDAVRGPGGVIVCRSTLTNPTNGCVPFNLFGTGVNNQPAVDYVLGTAFRRDRLKEDVFAATIRGNAFSTWAGPISLAAGIEHRRESVSGSVDPLDATLPTRPAYFVGNYRPTFGSYHVTEGFIEVVVPLAKDMPFAKSLDLNGAVRATDYSTSGYVTTWKLGATYSPIEDISFRVVRSRDIRAPNLAELFTTSLTATQVLNDPLNGNTSYNVFQVSRGNLALRPEVANSLGLGVVVQPQFLPGFAASLDYYDINIDDAISTVGAQIAVNQCAGGNTVFCDQITRGGPVGSGGVATLTSVAVSPINFAKQHARGLDFEASYRAPVLGGNLGLRFVGTRYLKNLFDNGISAPTDTVGTNGYNTVAKNSLPKWRYVASVAWDRDPVAMSLTARGFSAGKQNTSYIECTSGCPASTADHQTINDNSLPGAFYLDGNVTVKFSPQVQAYLSVDNILNKDPASVAYGPGLSVVPINANPVLYDVQGRAFRIGVRFKM